MVSKKEDYVPINKKYKDLFQQFKTKTGISLLCTELNKRTGGLMPGNICTIVGGPGSMKTTTAINICYDAIKRDKNVVYISLEEQPYMLYSKLLSRVSVDTGDKIETDVITKKLFNNDSEEKLFNKVIPHLNSYSGCFHIIGECELPSYKTSDFTVMLEELDEYIKQEYYEKNNVENHGIDIVVLDHLQILKFSDNTLDEFSLLNRYVSYFRQQCLNFLNKKREILVILLSQVNREGLAYAQKHDGEYKMQHLAEASEIERASSYIISVYTDPMSQLSKLLKMGAVKLRGSALPLSTINVFADGEFYQVGDTEVPEQQDYSASDLGLDLDTTSDEPVVTADLDALLGDLNL